MKWCPLVVGVADPIPVDDVVAQENALPRNFARQGGISPCTSPIGGTEILMALDFSNYASSDPHLSAGERALSVLVGLGLTSVASQPRSNVFLSMLALATGSYLAYRGATGYCPIKASFDADAVKLNAPRTSQA